MKKSIIKKQLIWSAVFTATVFTIFAKASSGMIDICQIPDTTSLKKIKTNKEPNFFFKSFEFKETKKKYVSFASSTGGRVKNYLIDMDDASTFIIPGSNDPVPLAGRFITVPGHQATQLGRGTTWGMDRQTMPVYAVSELLKYGEETKPVIELPLSGFYQSTGDLGDNKYRILTDNGGDGAKIIDIQMNQDEISVLGPAREICVNHRRQDFNLPMLSKNGKLVVGFDNSSKTTKVWKINDDNSCSVIKDLGFATSKADFDFTNSKITFHVRTDDPISRDYISTPTARHAQNVFVYDLKTDEMRRITGYSDSNAFYPTFLPDGTIVYGHLDGGITTFIHADPQNAESINMKDYNFSLAQDAIGRLWLDTCRASNTFASQPQISATIAINLDRQQCMDLVNSSWTKFIRKSYFDPTTYEFLRYGDRTPPREVRKQYQSYKKLRQSDLITACSDQNKRKNTIDEIGDSGDIASRLSSDGWSLVVKNCQTCHAGIMPATEADLKAQPEFLKKMIFMTSKGLMPPPSGLESQTKIKLIEYLESLNSQ